MSKLISRTCIILLFISINLQAQDDKQLAPIDAYFNALIVSNIDKSITWYSEGLGFKLINRYDSKEKGFSQANLKTGNSTLELIQLNSAKKPEEIYPGYTKKTRLIGFFKTGFLLEQFDDWFRHFKKRKLEFYGDIVKDRTTNKRMFILKDPDGNRIQFFEK